MSCLQWAQPELLEVRTVLMRKLFRKKPTRPLRQEYWVVAYVVGRIPIKYFRWDIHEVWRWTPSLSRACWFRSEDNARRAVEETEMARRFRYQILRITP